MSTHLDYAALETSSKWKHLTPPVAFAKSPALAKEPTKQVHPDSYNKIKEKKAWDFAVSPAKSLPMQAFMLYMSGGGVQIFSISIVFMLLLTPLKNLAGINSAFAQFAPAKSDTKSLSTLPLQKLVYLACNILTLGVGLWKCKSMGLLPTGTGDWLAFEVRGLVSCCPHG
ncbi:hypothetical protein AMATHDRAFT_73400 [Amanita thiersii Skay4041]|uniref:ER membrane protein complex subunit 4 n=1 Tax=Amanita thiersii Skay4041 TaxID=703135 RepID=A0A2A9NZP3_9AGAR|nr:hypothetical protein AMATHDRAFT_73400 [Amanita thiersii Skay4041]